MRKINKQKGTVLLITFLTLGILLLLGFYFLNFSLTESKISRSQEVAVQAYYLAEAGINEAIWKLSNDNTTTDGDPAWADDFIDGAKNPYPDGNYWSAGFFRSFANGSYDVNIENSDRGRGQIISIAAITLPNGRTAQRVVKTTVFKALSSPIDESAILSGGASENIDISFSKVKIDKGNLFSNHNLNISGSSRVEVYDNPETEDVLEGKTLTVGNFLKSSDSVLITQATCSKNACTPNCDDYSPGTESCPPNSIFLPLVDFDSSETNSFKSRAQTAQSLGQCQTLCNGSPCGNKCIYSDNEFEDLLWQVGQGGTLTLNNSITYVTGFIDLKGGRYLIVNGALLADDNIKIGESYSWTRKGQKDSGFSQITVIRPSETSPSGILSKRKIDFGLYSSFQQIDITGIIYANNEIKITSVPWSFNVFGGLIARKLSLTSAWQWFNVILDNDIILYGLGYKIDNTVINPIYSPVVTIDHWEESY